VDVVNITSIPNPAPPVSEPKTHVKDLQPKLYTSDPASLANLTRYHSLQLP
jgi:hypothetical protein